MEATTQSKQTYKNDLDGCTERSRPLFVVGIWRSGTSLLYALLNQHSDVALMYEGELVLLAPLFWLRRSKWGWLAKWELWNGALSRHRLNTNQIPNGVYDLTRAVNTAYGEYARQQKGAAIWGCKSPNYYSSLFRLARLFPDARFIIIWRDLRSICASIHSAARTSSFFRGKGMMLRAILGYRRLKLDCDRLASRGADVHQLHFEHLSQDPKDTMMGVCEFLKIPFEPKLTSLEDADRSAIENAKHHVRVKGSQILPSSETAADILPVPVRNKIESYLALWRQQSNNQWPVYPKSIKPAPPLSQWERAADQLSFSALRAWDVTKIAVFSLIPAWVWGGYRTHKYNRRLASRQSEASMKPK